jgi:DNA/RNA endonuclease G (NUC1)
LYNNSVFEKINGIAYIFTLLMFKKPNKTTINKNKTTIPQVITNQRDHR